MFLQYMVYEVSGSKPFMLSLRKSCQWFLPGAQSLNSLSFMGVKASYGMGLKSAQHRVAQCPCSIKCLFKEIRSALTPSLLFFVLSLCVVLEISKVQRSSPLHLPFVVGADSWLWRWLWDKVSYTVVNFGKRSHTYTMFFFEYSLSEVTKFRKYFLYADIAKWKEDNVWVCLKGQDLHFDI